MASRLDLTDVFLEFASMLDDRFANRVFTTEDSVRYLFFYSLTKNTDLHPNEIVLEYPDGKKEIDTYIPASAKNGKMFFEFKFHRQIPSGGIMPMPAFAGSLFKDIFRLRSLKDSEEPCRCFFVYVTDTVMIKYLRNPANNLDGFFDLKDDLAIDEDYIGRNSDTFIGRAGEVHPCRIRVQLSEDMDGHGHAARIYEVL